MVEIALLDQKFDRRTIFLRCLDDRLQLISIELDVVDGDELRPRSESGAEYWPVPQHRREFARAVDDDAERIGKVRDLAARFVCRGVIGLRLGIHQPITAALEAIERSSR